MKAFRKMFILAGLWPLLAFSQSPDIRLGEPGYGGTGCPAGSASVTLSPDRTQVSILFDQYLASAGGGSEKSLDRKSCNIAIPVRVPSGFSVSVFKVDYRGFVSVPRGGYALFNVEYFFAGSRGPSYSKYWRGGSQENYTLSNLLQVSATVWSGCGESVNLRVNSGMMTRTNRNYDDALATVDSVDVDAGIIYHIRWRRC